MIEYDNETRTYIETAQKLFTMFEKIRNLCEQELMQFTVEELEMMRKFYGNELTYPIYQDILDTLSGPQIEDRVH